MSYLQMVVLISVIGQVACVASAAHGEFGYDEGDPLGPDHWPEKYKQCAGKYQSPIDIDEKFVTRVSLPPLKLTGFKTLIKEATITNNGHTVMFTANFSEPVTLSGGPLSNPIYKFAQFHFHWGMNDSLGSEDMINNHSYPMELHMVFYNKDYNNTDIAQQNYEGLTVLAYFYEVSKEDNPAYSEILTWMPLIDVPGNKIVLKNVAALAILLPTNVDNYFSYIGSLTTPPCSEGVRWIDFKHPIHLSHNQLEIFRNIHSKTGVMKRNFRPVQPLSSRAVWYNSESPTSIIHEPQSEKDTSSQIIINVLALFVCVIFIPRICGKLFNFK